MSLFSLIGGIVGMSEASGIREEADAAMNEAIRRIDSLKVPDLTKKTIFEQFVQSGRLIPEVLERTIEENVAPEILAEDPIHQQKQSAQLAALEQMAKTGYDARSRLEMEKARIRAQQDFQANQKDILNKMAAGGTDNSGAQLAALLSGNQAAATNQLMANMEATAGGADRRAEVLKSLFSGYGDLRNTALDVEKTNVDVRNRAIRDAQTNAIQRQLQNMKNKTDVNLFNLQRKQKISDANIDMENRERLRSQVEAPQWVYQQEAQKARDLGNLYGKKAGVKMDQAAATAQSWADLGSSVDKTAASIMSAMGGGGAGGFTGTSQSTAGMRNVATRE